MQDKYLIETATDVLERLSAWRSSRRAGEAIPEELWSAAVDVAGRHGIYPTSRLLHLHYGDLKRRVQCAHPEATGVSGREKAGRSASPAGLAVPSRGPAASATFVEWLPAASPCPIGSCVMQVQSRQGASMRIDLHQVQPDALAAIIRTFAE